MRYSTNIIYWQQEGPNLYKRVVQTIIVTVCHPTAHVLELRASLM